MRLRRPALQSTATLSSGLSRPRRANPAERGRPAQDAAAAALQRSPAYTVQQQRLVRRLRVPCVVLLRRRSRRHSGGSGPDLGGQIAAWLCERGQGSRRGRRPAPWWGRGSCTRGSRRRRATSRCSPSGPRGSASARRYAAVIVICPATDMNQLSCHVPACWVAQEQRWAGHVLFYHPHLGYRGDAT